MAEGKASSGLLRQKSAKAGDDILRMAESSTLKSQGHQRTEVIAMVEAELDRLKVLTNFGHSLSVVWAPCSSSKLSGEVKGTVIWVYEEDCAKALETLRHEFIDYTISIAIKPYEKVTALYAAMFSAVLAKLGEESYREKEKAVEALTRIFSKPAV